MECEWIRNLPAFCLRGFLVMGAVGLDIGKFFVLGALGLGVAAALLLRLIRKSD